MKEVKRDRRKKCVHKKNQKGRCEYGNGARKRVGCYSSRHGVVPKRNVKNLEVDNLDIVPELPRSATTFLHRQLAQGSGEKDKGEAWMRQAGNRF